MSIQSPDLVDAQPAQGHLTLEKSPLPLTADDLFLLMAHSNALSEPCSDDASFAEGIEAITRVTLLQLPSPWRSRVGLRAWLSFSAYRRYIASLMTEAQLETARAEFALRHIAVSELLSPEISWKALRRHSQVRFDELVAGLGGASGVSQLFESAFRRQRNVLVRDWLIRIIPTLVLIAAVSTAVAMAIRFARSLTLGQ